MGFIFLEFVFLTLLLNIDNLSCPSSQRQRMFYKVEHSSLGSTLIGNNFTANSKVTCAMKCLSKYISACQSFIYDSVTKHCLLGAELDPSGTKPQTGQFIYSNCDLSLGYSYSILMQYGYCVYISPDQTDYEKAGHFCKNISGRLMMVSTRAKLQFLDNYTLAHSLTHIWMGLDDRTTEGTCIWSDQTQANISKISSLFIPGGPDDKNNNEDCFEAWRQSSSVFRLNDYPCGLSMPFICEYVFLDM